MKISKKNSGDFTPADEGTFRAVCVDVTPLTKRTGKYGEKEEFRIVFEIDAKREDGSPQCVWSRPYTPSLNEKANLRKFLKQWFGRDLKPSEEDEFDTEALIGRPANIVIVHDHGDNGHVYANIAACTPHKNGEALQPSGTFRRKKDRDNSENSAGYRKAAEPDTPTPHGDPVDGTQAGSDWSTVKVHVGKHAGVELRDLDVEAVRKLHDIWLPKHEGNPKPSADDRRLAAAVMEAMEVINGTQQQEDF